MTNPFSSKLHRLLSPESQAFYQIQFFPTLDSTNSFLKQLAKKPLPEGTLCVAGRQKAGRGTRGRSFFSDSIGGLYFSLLLRPHSLSPLQTTELTAAAALCLSFAIEKTLNLSPQIKWVNDLYLENKKVAGILCEGEFSPEGSLSHFICGVGVNLAPPLQGFPPEIEKIAGALTSSLATAETLRLPLFAAFLEEFRCAYQTLQKCGSTQLLKDYRGRLNLIGKRIFVYNGTSQRQATALDIDAHYRLLVRWEESGKEELLVGGDVSLSPLKDCKIGP